jgi:hypothetical protein
MPTKTNLLLSAALLSSCLLQSACATEPKTLPQPPYSEAQLNAFVNQKELGALLDPEYNERLIKTKMSIYKDSQFLIKRVPYTDQMGLLEFSYPGGVFRDIELEGQNKYVD